MVLFNVVMLDDIKWLLLISYDSTLEVPYLLVSRLETYYTVIFVICLVFLLYYVPTTKNAKVEMSDK
jgi:hypothetical protein